MTLKTFFLTISCLLITILSFAQDKSIVKITGFAPDYIGKSIEIFQIEDYMSMKEAKIASGEVKPDSTFSIVFFSNETQKVRVRCGNNKSFMYIQPNGEYDVYFPDRDPYDPYRPAGNDVELTFYGLDSNDVNYEILLFNRWVDKFVAKNFSRQRVNPALYNQLMDSFKLAAQDYYIADTGKYIFDYVRFTIASLDNIQQAGERNRYEKHDFYLKFNPIQYKNDAYMNYFTDFYRGMVPRLSMEANNRVYLGVLKSSPTLVMKALGLEYTLINMRIREMVMIQALSEVYFTDDFPQTNIITILDSVAKHAMFEDNKLIASNMIDRLTEVVAGGKAPDFTLKADDGTIKTLSDFRKKHLYIHFFDPSSDKNKVEIPLLLDLYAKYNRDVTFITICPKSSITDESSAVLEQLPWETYIVENSNDILKNYKIATFPNYVFIDAYSYIIGAPALSPQPNGSYETIDRSFFELQKVNKALRGEE